MTAPCEGNQPCDGSITVEGTGYTSVAFVSGWRPPFPWEVRWSGVVPWDWEPVFPLALLPVSHPLDRYPRVARLDPREPLGLAVTLVMPSVLG